MLMPRGDAWQTPCCGCSVPRMEARNAHPPPHNTPDHRIRTTEFETRAHRTAHANTRQVAPGLMRHSHTNSAPHSGSARASEAPDLFPRKCCGHRLAQPQR